eukprot:2673179-Rhodomonas_salina.2
MGADLGRPLVGAAEELLMHRLRPTTAPRDCSQYRTPMQSDCPTRDLSRYRTPRSDYPIPVPHTAWLLPDLSTAHRLSSAYCTNTGQ